MKAGRHAERDDYFSSIGKLLIVNCQFRSISSRNFRLFGISDQVTCWIPRIPIWVFVRLGCRDRRRFSSIDRLLAGLKERQEQQRAEAAVAEAKPAGLAKTLGGLFVFGFPQPDVGDEQHFGTEGPERLEEAVALLWDFRFGVDVSKPRSERLRLCYTKGVNP